MLSDILWMAPRPTLLAVYENSIPIAKSLTLKARSFKQGWLPSEVFTEDYFKVRKKVENYTMLTRPSNRYSGCTSSLILKKEL